MDEKLKTIKLAPPPLDLPIYGQIDPKEVSFFGRTNYESEFEAKRFIFGIKRSDRRQHLYIIGKSGVGKTKMIELLIRQDIASGYGLCLFDPHGDIIEDILNFIPENRIKDVVLINPTDTNCPVYFNPLKNIAPEMKHLAAQGLIEIMQKQFGNNWTPRLEHIFRFICLALFDYPAATMQGMIFMLTDDAYRQKVIKSIKDETIKQFWAAEFNDWSKKFNTETIMPLINNLSQFLTNPLLRHIFSQEENKIDLEKIMNEQKILLINLSKGKLGEKNSSFFGSLFIDKIYQASISKEVRNSERRQKDFYLYVDEFPDIVTDTFINILTEARKFGLSLTFSHQYRAQLEPQKIISTILGNIASLVVFRVSGDDAFALEKEMTPIFKAKDMINLGMQEFYVKMTIDGNAADPFSAETLKILPPPHPSYKNRIIEFNRQNYCAPLEEVKRKIINEETFIGNTNEKNATSDENKKSEIKSSIKSDNDKMEEKGTNIPIV